MSVYLNAICTNCNAINRVLGERLGAAKCGNCKHSLAIDHPYELTEATFDRHLSITAIPMVVDFWAPWCGPCRAMAPAYDQAAAQLAPHVRLAKLNTETQPKVAARFAIRSIPTLIAFKNGSEISRQSGAMDLSGLSRWIKANV